MMKKIKFVKKSKKYVLNVLLTMIAQLLKSVLIVILYLIGAMNAIRKMIV